jgi:N-carbamoylputrescine amidase
MKVTVCELRNELDAFARDWERLVAHVRSEASDLVVLPEMPFHPWTAWTRQFDPAIWQASVDAHDEWIKRLQELAPAIVLGSRPVTKKDKRFNEGFFWEPDHSYRAIHTKYYLPDEEGFWEASWYQRGNREFVPVQSSKAKIGMLICTELWFTEHARTYARAGVHLLICPRATPIASVDKWVAGGRVAAVTSGAFCLSSSFGGSSKHGIEWAGTGWIIEPEEGDVLALTSREHPFVTKEIDLHVAEQAKHTYPRYVPE